MVRQPKSVELTDTVASPTKRRRHFVGNHFVVPEPAFVRTCQTQSTFVRPDIDLVAGVTDIDDSTADMVIGLTRFDDRTWPMNIALRNNKALLDQFPEPINAIYCLGQEIRPVTRESDNKHCTKIRNTKPKTCKKRIGWVYRIIGRPAGMPPRQQPSLWTRTKRHFRMMMIEMHNSCNIVAGISIIDPRRMIAHDDPQNPAPNPYARLFPARFWYGSDLWVSRTELLEHCSLSQGGLLEALEASLFLGRGSQKRLRGVTRCRWSVMLNRDEQVDHKPSREEVEENSRLIFRRIVEALCDVFERKFGSAAQNTMSSLDVENGHNYQEKNSP